MAKLTEKEKFAFQTYLASYNMVVRSISRDLRSQSQMSIEHYDVLVTLEYAAGHRLRLSELAERVLLSRSGLTRLVDRLEEKGYVNREVCPNDRRGSFAVLTDEGIKARMECWEFLQEAIHKHFASKFASEKQLSEIVSACSVLAADHAFSKAAETAIAAANYRE